MQSRTSIKLILGFVLASVAVIAQTKPAFEAATVKPAAPLDQAKLIAAAQAGGKLPIAPVSARVRRTISISTSRV